MTFMLQIWTLTHLLLSSSSSSPCGNQQPWFNTEDGGHAQTQELEEQEEPWLVSILGNGQRCQGTVLNNWWILTAASCFLLMKPSDVELITSGGHFSTITVSQFLSHRGFSSWARPPINDLGLVMLGQPIDLRRRDMWPVCIPDGNSSLSWARCRVHKREQDGSTQWLEKIDVYILEVSECTSQWPGTAEQWNICMARKTYDEKDCRVPIGSPVLCQDPASHHWELRGIVSQTSTDCASLVLACQVVPHLEWLRGERILKNPVPPALEEEVEDQQPTISLTEQPFETAIATSSETPMTNVQPPSATSSEIPLITVQSPSATSSEIPLITIHSLSATSSEIPLITLQYPSATSSEIPLITVQSPSATSSETPVTTVQSPPPYSSETPLPIQSPPAYSSETPVTTVQSPPMAIQFPIILPLTGKVFGVPPTAAKAKQSLSEVIMHTTVGHSVPVKSVQPLASATITTIFVVYPTAKPLSPVTSTRTKLPVTSTRTKSPVTSTRTKSRVKSKRTKSQSKRTKLPVTSTRTKLPVTSTTIKSPLTSTRRGPHPQTSTLMAAKTSARSESSTASPTTKPRPIKPTRSRSTLAALTAMHLKHVIIIPMTTRKSLTSPASTKPSPRRPYRYPVRM